MKRFEVTGCAADYWPLPAMQEALKKAGARDVRSRHAFGWSNQPRVATFAADCEADARIVCDRARSIISREPFPAAPWIIGYRYD